MGSESDQWTMPGREPGSRRVVAELLIPVLVMILILAAFAVWFLSTEETLYHADQVAYWSYSRSLADLMRRDPIASVGAVIRSVAENDVNLLPAVPISMLMVVFGGSRQVYVLAVIIVYGLAAALALVFALSRIGPRPPPWAAPLAFALVATVWQPIFVGYLGIGGVALALIVIGLVSTGPEPPRARTLVAAGCILAILVLFRRWWGIWALAFAIVYCVGSLTDFLRSPKRDRKMFWMSVRSPAIMLTATTLTVISLAAPIIVSRLRTDYADRFSAYSYGSAARRLGSIVDHFGLVGLIVLVACIALLLRSPQTRRSGAFLVAHLACTFAVMIRIQDHSPQHWYLYSPQILLILGLALGRVAAERGWRFRRPLLLTLATIGILTVAAVFLPAREGWTKRPVGLMPADVIRPDVRRDLGEVERLLSYTDRILAGREGHLYVLASSHRISDQVLGFANLSLGTTYRTPHQILGAAHVDRRDGFPKGLLSADLVLVADPVQYHLRPGDQRVIGEPAKSFLEGTDIALAFSRMPPIFTFDGGVKVIVFQRTRYNTREELAALSHRLRTAYPDRPEIYSPE